MRRNRMLLCGRGLALAMTLSLLAGCSSVSKAPKQPVLSVSEIQLVGDPPTVTLELLVRNDYEADYVVTGGRLTLAIATAALVELEPSEPLQIAPYGIEVLLIENKAVADPAAVELLRKLEQGSRRQIGYHIFGTLEINGESNMSIDQRGQLNATPGKPGNFRGPAGINRGDRRLIRRHEGEEH